MLTDVALLTDSEFYAITPSSKNMDNNASINPIVLEVQRFFILPIICEPQYNELMLQISTNTLTPANQLLMNYIKPVIAWFVLEQGIPFYWAKIRDAGLVNQIDDTYQPISERMQSYSILKAGSHARNNLYSLRRFICNNKQDYPLITVDTCGCGSCIVGGCCCNNNCKGSLHNRFFTYVN